MPAPLVFLAYGVAALLAAGGTAAAVDGVCTLDKARSKVAGARRRHERAVEALEAARANSQAKLEALGFAKLEASGKVLTRFARVLKRFGAEAQARARGQAKGGLPPLTAADLTRFEQVGSAALSTLQGAAQGVAAGAALSAGVSGLAATFGTTAGGVAIASLEGAAASNAALAFLGGGSLASGGGGMAAGTALLGGLAVAPVIFIAGFALASHAEKAHTQACEFEADVETKVANLARMQVVLRGVDARAEELRAAITAFATRLDDILDLLESVPARERRHLTPHIEGEVALAWSMARGLSRLLDAQLLDAAGNLSPDAGQALQQTRSLLPG